VKKGDLVRCSGACYDAPINHHEMGAAIRHYDGVLPDGTLGVIVDMITADSERFWYLVLAEGRTAWVNGSGLRAA
jgi:hypothetical protein